MYLFKISNFVFIKLKIGLYKNSIPNVARYESKKPWSNAHKGFIISDKNPENPSVFKGMTFLSKSCIKPNVKIIMFALKIEGLKGKNVV